MQPFYRGKVRDLYEVDSSRMILAATDRLSAFDVVFPDAVPGKGELLTRISVLWFQALRKSGIYEKYGMMDHLLETDLQRFPVPFSTMSELKNRSVLVQRTRRIDFECVVRGYLAGSAWKEYQSTGSLPGIQLPAGLRQSDQLPQPLFTPATKAEVGDHDENVSFERMKQDLGDDLAEKLKQVSIDIFLYASGKMAEAGILLCDTKFEFGLLDGKLVLIDEVLTPDSSRYWDASTWAPGTNPPGYDKQYVRDYVEELGWNKSPPAPHLPDSVIEKTIGLYQSIEKRIEQVLR